MSRLPAATASELTKRLIQIADQIVQVFYAYGKAHEIIGNSELCTLLHRDRSMRHDGGVFNQALYTSQTLSQRENSAALQEAAALSKAALREERNHPAKSIHLLFREFMLRMRLQTGI